MLKHLVATALTITLLWATPFAHGEKTTEIFIPIGQSPGLSGKYSYVGTISAINAQKRSMTVSSSTGSYTTKITGTTQIWLDKSKLGLTNRIGSFADLEKGLLVEVKYAGEMRKHMGPAEWIKVQITK